MFLICMYLSMSKYVIWRKKPSFSVPTGLIQIAIQNALEAFFKEDIGAEHFLRVHILDYPNWNSIIARFNLLFLY